MEMVLDCIETQDGDWAIIDLDNDSKTFVEAPTIERAWHAAAIRLAAMINAATGCLS
jgi:hypothetical protein